jgi:hypothetical protein
VPFTGALAAILPPAYAVLAGVHSILLFAARLYTGQSGAATITAMITGLLIAAASPIGLLVIVPLAVAGASFDVALSALGLVATRKRSISPVVSALIAGAVSALALFAVSLPVFSAEHLAAGMLMLTLIGRVIGQIAAAYAAVVLLRMLARAGVRGRPRSENGRGVGAPNAVSPGRPPTRTR